MIQWGMLVAVVQIPAYRGLPNHVAVVHNTSICGISSTCT